MHDRDVFYRGVRVLSCFQWHLVVLGVLVSSIHLERGDFLLEAFIPLNKSSSRGHQCFKHL